MNERNRIIQELISEVREEDLPEEAYVTDTIVAWLESRKTPEEHPGWVKSSVQIMDIDKDHPQLLVDFLRERAFDYSVEVTGPSRINCDEVGSIDLWFYDGGIAVARDADWNIYTKKEADHMIHNGEIFFGE